MKTTAQNKGIAAALHSPAAERNQRPILQALQQWLPAQGRALEIASGTGQHVAFFAAHMPGWQWQPSDAHPQGFDSINAWCAQAGVSNVHAPMPLDVLASRWPSESAPFDHSFDAIFCANMLHIAPWECCAGLMEGAARNLTPQGQLVTYGPYLEEGVPTAPSNLHFDASLRQRNPAWGIRQLSDVSAAAAQAGLQLSARHALPSNNLLLVFKRAQ